MTHFAYLLGLLLAVGGLLLIDRRWHLAFWYDAKRTLRTILPAMAVFILWDFAGIDAGIFAHGAGAYNLSFTILPQFPIEELGFLFLLCYLTLLVWRGVRR